MSDSDLVNYVQEQTRQGVSAQDLRVTLMEAGWHESDINNALHDVAAGLYPATPGASIHEDLAQVRTVVVHLATRVRGIEAKLASSGMIEMQGSLPSGTLGPAQEISAPKPRYIIRRAVPLLVLIALFGLLGSYADNLVQWRFLSPVVQLIVASLVGLLLLVSAIIAMRRYRTWTSSVLTASAITLWAITDLISWRVYHYFEWPTASALGVLMIVIAAVIGIWTQRYTQPR